MQITVLRLLMLDGDPNTPLCRSLYLGHPACSEFTGEHLAKVIYELLMKIGLSKSMIREGLVGGAFDGQYFILNVLGELAKKCVEEETTAGDICETKLDESWFQIWDGAHLLELAVADVIENNTNVKNAIRSLTDMIIFIGQGKAYEALVEAHTSQDKETGQTTKIYQPKQIKSMKFVGHSLKSVVNLIREQDFIIRAMFTLQKDVKKEPQATSYITLLSSPKFKVTLMFIKDFLICVTRFSYLLQADDQLLNDYLNNFNNLIRGLKSINFGFSTSFPHKRIEGPITKETTELFSDFITMTYQAFPDVVVSSHATRSTRINNVNIVRKALLEHQTLIWALSDNLKNRLNKLKGFELLNSGASFLNSFLSCVKISDDKINACVICGALMPESRVKAHFKRAHSGEPVSIANFALFDNLDTNQSISNIDFNILLNLVDCAPNMSADDLRSQYELIKSKFKDFCLENKKLSKVKRQGVLKMFLCAQNSFPNCLAVKQLLAKIVCATSSEAICESFGSIMEKYHRRFTNTDLEDLQVQMEQFVSLNGPDVIHADVYISKVMECLDKEFVSGERAKFKAQSKVISSHLNKKSKFPFWF